MRNKFPNPGRRKKVELPNQVVGATWIVLTKGRFALIDNEDLDRVSTRFWTTLLRPGRSPYAFNRMGGRTQYLHRFVMNAPKGMDVDHVDGNGLDCRKTNLRVCTHRQNQRNYTKTKSVTSSKFKGVCFDKSRGKWIAAIKSNRKTIHLGRFDNEEDAARKYDAAAAMHFGEFAKLNFN